MTTLMDYHWAENNVRELENEMERLAIFTRDGSSIRLKDLSEKIKRFVPLSGKKNSALFIDEEGEPLTHEEFEKKYIRFILSRVGGNKAKAAQIMGMPRSTLRGKMRKLDVRA